LAAAPRGDGFTELSARVRKGTLTRQAAARRAGLIK
jgi:hypothetical protein